MIYHLFLLTAQRKNLVGIAQHQPSGLGEFQVASKPSEQVHTEEALGKIKAWLATDLLPAAQGAAIFVRGTFGGAFMLPMQFAVPLPNWIAMYPTPNIYHLVEIKHNYHRYVVLFALPDRASILEVNLGAATTQAWINQSELRMRVGSEWARSHY